MSIVSKTTTVKSRKRMPEISQTFNLRQTKTVAKNGPGLRAKASTHFLCGKLLDLVGARRPKCAQHCLQHNGLNSRTRNLKSVRMIQMSRGYRETWVKSSIACITGFTMPSPSPSIMPKATTRSGWQPSSRPTAKSLAQSSSWFQPMLRLLMWTNSLSTSAATTASTLSRVVP